MSTLPKHLSEPNTLCLSKIAQWSTKTCNSLQLAINLINLLYELGENTLWEL